MIVNVLQVVCTTILAMYTTVTVNTVLLVGCVSHCSFEDSVIASYVTVAVVSGREYDGGGTATLLLPGGVLADVGCVSYCSFEDSAIASCDYNCNRYFRSCVRRWPYCYTTSTWWCSR